LKILPIIASLVITGLSLLVFFAFPDAVTVLAFSGETFFRGEIHRLFTFPFTHATHGHLIENLLALLATTFLAYEVGLRGGYFIFCFLGASFLIALSESPFFPTLLLAGASVGIVSILGFISIKGSNFIPKFLLIPILLLPLIIKYGLTVWQTGFSFVSGAEFLFHFSGFIAGIIFFYSFKLLRKEKRILQRAKA